MARIGKYEYPEVQIDTLLNAIKVLIENYQSSPVNDENIFAKALGHTTNKSGTFISKMSSLRKYGLIEPREIKVTNLSKHIVKPLNNKEKEESLSKMIENVELWMDLYKRLKNKSPSKDDFKIALVELTGDRDKALKWYEKIRGLYIEAIGYYNKETTSLNSYSNSYEIEKEEELNKPSFNEDNMIKGEIAGVYIQIPKNLESVIIAKQIVNILEQQIKSETQNINSAETQQPKETTEHPKEKSKRL